MTDLKRGMPAPDFTLPLATFGTISLSNMRGKPVVLYFYPKDDTPGCTLEACSFQSSLPDFGNFDAAVIGISKDSVESHAAFAKKYGIRFHLASDAHSDTAESYGVWILKNSHGAKHWGIERTTFLIDRHGIIRALWPRVKVEGHAEEVLRSVQALHMGQPLPGEEPPPPPPPPPAPVKPALAAKAPVAKASKASTPPKPVKAPPPVKARKPEAKKAKTAAPKKAAPGKTPASKTPKKVTGGKPPVKKPVQKKSAKGKAGEKKR